MTAWLVKCCCEMLHIGWCRANDEQVVGRNFASDNQMRDWWSRESTMKWIQVMSEICVWWICEDEWRDVDVCSGCLQLHRHSRFRFRYADEARHRSCEVGNHPNCMYHWMHGSMQWLWSQQVQCLEWKWCKHVETIEASIADCRSVAFSYFPCVSTYVIAEKQSSDADRKSLWLTRQLIIQGIEDTSRLCTQQPDCIAILC